MLSEAERERAWRQYAWLSGTYVRYYEHRIPRDLGLGLFFLAGLLVGLGVNAVQGTLFEPSTLLILGVLGAVQVWLAGAMFLFAWRCRQYARQLRAELRQMRIQLGLPDPDRELPAQPPAAQP